MTNIQSFDSKLKGTNKLETQKFSPGRLFHDLWERFIGITIGMPSYTAVFWVGKLSVKESKLNSNF